LIRFRKFLALTKETQKKCPSSPVLNASFAQKIAKMKAEAFVCVLTVIKMVEAQAYPYEPIALRNNGDIKMVTPV